MPRRRRRARHARRHRLAHDDDQRARRPRLGRRRHRGRGGHARRAARARHAVVVGVRMFRARCATGVTATDLVLTLTELLRKHGVVGRFVEFCGDGLSALSLRRPRDALQHVARVRRDGRALPGRRRDAALPARHRPRRRSCRSSRPYTKEQGLFRRDGDPTPDFSDAGRARPRRRRAEPRRPAPPAGPRAAGRRARRASARAAYPAARDRPRRQATPCDGRESTTAVVIAAITSCTNTSNPSVMVAAGLLARNAVARGLRAAPYVKTSLAPGSRVVTDYLAARRPAGAARHARLPARRLRLHDLHRQLGTAARTRSPRPCATTSSPSARCSRATATSRAASTRRCAPATSPLPRSSSPTRSPARSTSTSSTSRSAPTATGADVYLRELWPSQRRGARGRSRPASRPSCSSASTRRSGTATSAGRRCRLRRARSSPGTTDSTYVREPSFFQDLQPEPRAARRRRRRALPRACSATRSRPTTSRPPARSRATCPPAAT